MLHRNKLLLFGIIGAGRLLKSRCRSACFYCFQTASNLPSQHIQIPQNLHLPHHSKRSSMAVAVCQHDPDCQTMANTSEQAQVKETSVNINCQIAPNHFLHHQSIIVHHHKHTLPFLPLRALQRVHQGNMHQVLHYRPVQPPVLVVPSEQSMMTRTQ